MGQAGEPGHANSPGVLGGRNDYQEPAQIGTFDRCYGLGGFMSFSATIRGVNYNGVGGVQVYGDWSGSAGGAAGSMTVSGVVNQAVFQKLDALDNTTQVFPRVGVSISSGITTLTIENQDNVTNRKFIISKMSG